LRIDRYEQFLHERGAGDRIQVFITDQEPAPAYELGERMFNEFAAGRQPTAIYATSDTTAIGLMQAAFQAGVAIPGALSIVGYDDIDISPFTIPPLTTVSQDGAEMGEAAADLLFTMIDENLNREEVSDVVLSPHLVVRQSTTAPP
jgi:LacI family transcriptional regulator